MIFPQEFQDSPSNRMEPLAQGSGGVQIQTARGRADNPSPGFLDIDKVDLLVPDGNSQALLKNQLPSTRFIADPRQGIPAGGRSEAILLKCPEIVHPL